MEAKPNPEDEPIIPSNIQRCPECNEPYNPKPGVFMVKCLECGADMWEDPSDHPDGEVDIPLEAAQKMMDDRVCPRCGATWPFEETEHGTLKQSVCPSCGCGIAMRG